MLSLKNEEGSSYWDLDVWQLEDIFKDKKTILATPARRLDFTNIKQGWLKDAVKTYIKYSLATHPFSTCKAKLVGLKRFSWFLESNYHQAKSANINRVIIVDFLVHLKSNFSSSTCSGTLCHFKVFLELCQREKWLTLPSDAIIYKEDFTKRTKGLPQYIPNEVLNKINNSLKDAPPQLRRMVMVLQESGMRVGELVALSFDCLTKDNSENYFIRYFQFKMKKEHIIPISQELSDAIIEQQQSIQRQLGNSYQFLFAATRRSGNYDKAANRHLSATAFRDAMKKFFKDKNIYDSTGKLWNFHPHQFRHTVGTNMINNGVPQYIVQRYLGHESPLMTMVYAHIHDETLRKEIEKYYESRVVNFQGETAELDETSLSSNDDLKWFKKNVQARALEHGYCARPKVLGNCDIPGFDGCYNCPHWRTNKNFLPILQDTLERTNKVLEKARNCGWELQVNKNEPIKHNLEKVIESLEVEGNE